jgi:hypothetical protein
MAPRRRLTIPYPHLATLKQTIASNANLAGTRRFYAGQGIAVFADAKKGMSRAAGDVWLRPSAYRHMSNYLDLRKYASVAGIRLVWNATADPRLADEPLYDDFCTVVADGRGRRVGEKKIEVQSIEAIDGPWQMKAVLTYDHFTTLGGDRLLDEGRAVVYARRRDDDTVDLAFIMERQEDYEVVRQWISGSDPNTRWLARTVVLPRENPNRQAKLELLLEAVHTGSLVAVSHPDMFRGSSEPKAATDFVNIYRRASYETELTHISTVVERMEADGGVIGALTVYAYEAAPNEVISLRVRQRPNDQYLSLMWQPSKALDELAVEELTHAKWQKLRPVDWTDEQKRVCLLQTWAAVVDAIEPPAEIAIAASA